MVTTTTMIARPIIFGEVLFDVFPDGDTVLGGAPFNVAWHLQAFGAQPLMVSCVGQDERGAQILAAMQQWGMDTSAVQQSTDYPTGIVDVSLLAGEPHYTIPLPSAWDYIAAPDLPNPLPPAAVLYHGSLALRHAVSYQAWQTLSRTVCPNVLDVNLREPWWENMPLEPLLRQADWLKLNAQELHLLVPHLSDTTAQVQYLTEHYDLTGIILTQGKDGALALMQGQEPVSMHPDAVADVVDTVGAGDAFCSVVLLGLLHHWSLPVLLHRAQTFASAVVGLRGATCADPAFYQPFKQAWQLD